jgi:hypothetical protein
MKTEFYSSAVRDAMARLKTFYDAELKRDAMTDDRYPVFTKREGPDLQKLVEAYGGYDMITKQAWVRWDEQSRWWREYLRSGGRAEDIAKRCG